MYRPVPKQLLRRWQRLSCVSFSLDASKLSEVACHPVTVQTRAHRAVARLFPASLEDHTSISKPVRHNRLVENAPFSLQEPSRGGPP